MNEPSSKLDWVGPVLEAGPLTNAVVEAIRQSNPDTEVIDRGGYVRVLSPRSCRVTRTLIERYAGGPFRLPTDLECIMSSFKGKLTISEEHVCWELAAEKTS